MPQNLLPALSWGGPGVEDATVAGATNEIALPTLRGEPVGSPPAAESARFVHVSIEQNGGAGGAIVKPGYTGDAMTDADGFHVGDYQPGLILNVTGYTHLIHRGSGAGGTLHIVPLANQ